MHSGLSCKLLLALALGLTVPATRAQTPVYKIPGDIPYDYSADVTTNLQAFIDSVPDGSVIAFPGLAYDSNTVGYRIEGTLTLSGRQDLTIEGNGAILRAFDPLNTNAFSSIYIRSRSQWRATGSANIAFLDLIVYGAHTNAGAGGTYDEDREAQTAFDITGGSVSVRVDRCQAYNTFGDGVYIGGNARHVTIQNTHVAKVGRQCVAPCSGSDFLIQSNVLEDSRRGIIDIEPYASTWRVDNVRIIGNTLGSSRLLCFAMAGGGNYGAVYLADNIALGANGVPKIAYARDAAPSRRGPFIAVNNSFAVGGSSAAAFQMKPVDGIFFAGNWSSLPSSRAMTAVSLGDCRGAIVVNNLFKDATVPISANAASSPLWTAGNTVSSQTWSRQTVVGEFPSNPGCYHATAPFSNGTVLAIWRMADGAAPLSNGGLRTSGDFAAVKLDSQGGLLDGFAFHGASDYNGADLPWLHPDAPSNLAAVAMSTSRIDLSWSLASDALSTVVIEQSTDGTNWSAAAAVAVPVAACPITNLHYDTTYCFRTATSNSIAVSPTSVVVSALTLNVLPAAPIGLTLTAVSDGRIDLVWADNSDNEDLFRIERAPDSGGAPGAWQSIATVGRNLTATTNTGLSAGTRYHYRVRAGNELGDSDPSPTASATTLAQELPDAPVAVRQLNTLLSTQVDLSWRDASDNETAFHIERAPDVGGQPGAWTEISAVGTDATGFSDTNVAAGTACFYRIRTGNAGGLSAYSTVIRAVTATVVTETWTGANSIAWPVQWTRSGTKVPCTIQGNGGQMGGGSAGTSRMQINTTQAEDVEQLVWMNFNNNSIRGGCFARCQDRDSDTYYGVEDGTDSNNRSLFKMVDGVKTSLATLSTLVAGINYWIRFRVQLRESGGTDLRVKVWKATDPEPADWSAKVTDTEPRLQDVIGRFGLLGVIGISGSRRVQYDNYTAAAAGAPGKSRGALIWLSLSHPLAGSRFPDNQALHPQFE